MSNSPRNAEGARAGPNAGASLADYAGPARSSLWRRGAVLLRPTHAEQKLARPHAHFAIQLSFGIGAPVRLRLRREDI